MEQNIENIGQFLFQITNNLIKLNKTFRLSEIPTDAIEMILRSYSNFLIKHFTYSL